MKIQLIVTGIVLPIQMLLAQVPIRDQSIIYQQERMVFKQWDRGKFTPKKGWLGLNPLYWLTWGLHPNYPKKDLRPLGPAGPQTQRLALALTMQSIDADYEKESEDLRNTALSEMVNYDPLFSDLDPLWLLYYRYELAPLYDADYMTYLNGVSEKEKDYLVRTGAYDWFVEESGILAQRLQSARTVVLDRGSRMLAYHQVLADYRKLRATWDTKKQNAGKFISLRYQQATIKARDKPLAESPGKKTDRQIIDDILRKSKL